MATWNVTGLGDHIPEIVEIMKKREDGNVECHWIRRPHPRDSGDHEEEIGWQRGMSLD